MMLKAMAVLALALLAQADKADWKTITSKDGKFKAWLPASATAKTQKAGGLTLYLLGAEASGGAAAVVYVDLPIGADETAAQTQARLDGAKNGAVNNVKGKLTSESKITLAGKHPGREFTAELPAGKGIMKARIYLVGKRLYQVLAVGPKEYADKAEVKKFLGSFELVP